AAGDVVLVEHLLEVGTGQHPAVVVARPAPRVERAALELRGVDGRVVAEPGQAADRAPVGRGGAVEALRVTVLPGKVHRAGTRRPGGRAAAVVVRERNRDAVRADQLLRVGHVGGVRVVPVLVL